MTRQGQHSFLFILARVEKNPNEIYVILTGLGNFLCLSRIISSLSVVKVALKSITPECNPYIMCRWVPTSTPWSRCDS